MAESITIHFQGKEDGGQEVGIYYHPATSEWTARDAMLAKETALHALVLQAIQERQQEGLSVPQAMLFLAEAHTFRELF